MSDAPVTRDGRAAVLAVYPVRRCRAGRRVSACTIGMAVRSPDSRLIDVSPAYARMLGYERDELVALDSSAIVHPEDGAIGMTWWRRLAAGGWTRISVRSATAQG